MIGRRNHVQVVGKGTETIVWAHGFGTDQSAWSQQLTRFKCGYRNLLFDHVGSGHSDWSAYSVKRYTSLYAFANDLVDILEAFDVHDCTFIGHSVSGMVGMLASLLAPELFGRVIAIGASPRYLRDDGYPGVFTTVDLDEMFCAAHKNYAAWVSGFAPGIAQNADRPEVAEAFADNLMRMRADIALSMLRMVLESDHRRELPQVKHPVLFLHAVNDPAVPVAVGRYLHAHVKDSEYLELQAEGHLPHLSSPTEVTEALEQAIHPAHREQP